METINIEIKKKAVGAIISALDTKVIYLKSFILECQKAGMSHVVSAIGTDICDLLEFRDELATVLLTKGQK
jgi:hypothetical protein